MGREIELLARHPKTRRNLDDRTREKTGEDGRIGRKFGRAFFHGDRRTGCAGDADWLVP